jgi:MinD-like ATPase involved in chromosome partitioning or flagellar assembly
VLLHAADAPLPPTHAAALGACAVAALPPDPDALARAVRVAAAAPAGAASPAGGALVAVLAGAGGQGATTVAHALAGSLAGPVAALDLDLAGGGLAGLAGLTDDLRDAGLAGEERGEEAFERLARPAPYGRLVPAPARPDLAWLVRDGVVAGLCRAARSAHRWTVADVARPLGPTVEALLAADLLLLVTRVDERAVAAASRQRALLSRLAVPDHRVQLVANGVRRRDAVRMHALSRELGAAPAIVVPDAPGGAEEVERALAEVPALLEARRGAA